MKTRTIASTLAVGIVAATSVALAAAPSHASEYALDLEATVFSSKTAIRVDAQPYVDQAVKEIRQIRATAGGHSCTSTTFGCVIQGVSSSRTTDVTVVGLDAKGAVIASQNKRLRAVKRVKKTRVILCKRNGNKHEMQVAGLPFNESSMMKARVKLAPAGRPLPRKWRTANDSSWVDLGGLKAGKSYRFKAQAWNVTGWGAVVRGIATAGQGCQ